MALQDLIAARDGYAAALAADALNPQPSYSLDGQSVDRDKWRETMLKMINQIQLTINAMSPYVVKTKVVL